ncbi:MAG: ATP-dependent DNA helicase [Patescibacteria group bacterium]
MSEKKLNPSQKQAVEYTSGPLIIVAGAGTGKTTVITEKICYLIKNKLAKPEEILALTFTDKSAAEMAERVDGMIEIGYLDLQISTFHAFCQKLLEHHAIDIGLSNQFKLLTETDAWMLMRKNLDKFNLDYYRALGNPSKHIHELISHFSKCKDELISPQEYLDHAENLKMDKDDMNTEEKNQLSEIANAYHAYNQLLLDNNALDFGDLIYYAHKLLTQRPLILDALCKRFKYILIDEFQDVNWAQYQLVQMLAGDSAKGLTVVGDDDQSIYAFRGASVSNILRFKDDFPKAKEIVLNENYRSNQGILDYAYKLIQNNNPDRLEAKLKIDKKLKSNLTGAVDAEKSVVHISCSTLDDEVKAVVKEISKLKKADKDATWDDFAILIRANNHSEPFISALEKTGIPYEFLAAAGLYRQPVVLDVINYLKLLENYCESSAIYRMLCLPFLHFDEHDIQKISYWAKRKGTSYYEAIKRAQEVGLSKEGVIICDKILNLIHTGLQKVHHEKPTIVLYEFLEQSGYLEYLTKEEDRGNREVIRQIYQLKEFFEDIANYESVTPGANTSNYLEHLNYILESGDRGAMYQLSDTPDSVNIITVHKAKGLEFKYVFVVNLVEDRFPARKYGESIEIPTELVKEQLPEGDSHWQEERRLFYVAMTRAKNRLYLTSANDYGGVRSKKISRFLDELGFKVGDVGQGSALLFVKRESGTKSHADSVPEVGSAQFKYELPKAFSFSQINIYNDCPYKYKLAHIISIPTKGNAVFSFGQTMHSTMQKFYQRIQELNKVEQGSLFNQVAPTPKDDKIKVPTLDELIKIYETSWIDEWYKDKIQKDAYYKNGKDILKIFYESEKDNWTIPIALESRFKIKVGEYLISGRIDRVDQLKNGTLEIIDYKTGVSKEKIEGDDKNQLLIYQMAVEQLAEYKNFGSLNQLTFYYLNDNLKLSFMGTPKELEKLEEKLIKIIDKIHAGDFTATPSQFACQHCDFRDICQYKI